MRRIGALVNKPRELGIAGASPGNRVNALRPYLGHGSISYRESSGWSVNHSMQVSSALDGWQLPGIARTWSGQPADVTMSYDACPASGAPRTGGPT